MDLNTNNNTEKAVSDVKSKRVGDQIAHKFQDRWEKIRSHLDPE